MWRTQETKALYIEARNIAEKTIAEMVVERANQHNQDNPENPITLGVVGSENHWRWF